MTRLILTLLFAFVAMSCSFLSAQEVPEGFTALFDGKTLDGWEQKNGSASFEVLDGTIQGTTAEGSPNSFLCTSKEYADFELHFEALVAPALNSGVQVRSQSKADYKDGRVHGPQVEIAETGFAGYVFSEGTGRKWISKERQKHEHLKSGQWNQFRVVVQDKHIKTWINGVEIGETEVPEVEPTSGFIGLQVHSIGKGSGPFHVQWRNVVIKELVAEESEEGQPTETTEGSGSKGSGSKGSASKGSGSKSATHGSAR